MDVDEPFGLLVRFRVKEGRLEDFDALVERTIAKIKELEPGTLAYVSHRTETNSTERHFYELYASREAFEFHENQPHIQAFLRDRESLLDGVEVEWLHGQSRVLRADD